MSTSSQEPAGPDGEVEVTVDRWIAADPVDLPILQAGLVDIRRAATERFGRLVSDEWWHAFETACAEILNNVIRYAYAPDAAEQPIEIHLSAGPTVARMVLLDHGKPFPGDLSQVTPPDPLSEGGYGLFIARRCVDRLEYARTGSGRNRWLLEKMWAAGTS